MYGYLSDSTEAFGDIASLDNYGFDVKLVLGREARSRTTVILGDALRYLADGNVIPEPIDAPTILCAPPALEGNLRGSVLPDRFNTLERPFEAMIHGGVFVDDISHMVVSDATQAECGKLDAPFPMCRFPRSP